ncbi:MAG: phage/plasmid primase, P4 family [Candidatus Hydrogenedentota bacterium]
MATATQSAPSLLAEAHAMQESGCHLVCQRVDRSTPEGIPWTSAPAPCWDESRAWIAEEDRIAIYLGRSKRAVLDIDPRNGGAIPDGLPKTQTVRTGGGGWHFHFAFDSSTVDKQRTIISPGVELLAGNSIVPVVGSMHHSGNRYEWEPNATPDDVELAPLPNWLAEKLKQRAPRKPATPNGAVHRNRHAGDANQAYLLAGLAGECEKVRNATKRERNSTLYKSSCAVGELVSAGLSEDVSVSELTEAALDAGLEPREIPGTIRSGINRGKQNPRSIPERVRAAPAKREKRKGCGRPSLTVVSDNGHAPDAAMIAPSDDLEFRRSELCTDLAAARIFCNPDGVGAGSYVKHTPGLGWQFYDGTRWRLNDNGRVESMAASVGDWYRNEARRMVAERENDKLIKHVLAWARYCESERGVRAILKMSENALHAPIEDFDNDPHLVNCQNCTLDFSRLAPGAEIPSHRDHCSADMLTRLIKAGWYMEAKRTSWESFLARIQPNEAIRRFLKRAIGYSLLGLTVEQVFFIAWGGGANGKTTLLNTILHAFGSDYALQCDPRSFMQTRPDAIRNDLADLRGVRLVTAIETSDGNRLDESLVKAATGGESLRVRRLYQEAFSYRPQFKLWMATNHKPRIAGTDHAIWRRVLLIPFTVTISDADRDPKLAARLEAEAEGILAWAVEGAVEYLRDGLNPPDCVRAATREYRNEQDTVGQFIADACVVNPSVTSAKGELYIAYSAWCEGEGEKPVSKRRFGESLLARPEIDDGRSSDRKSRIWIGISKT